MGSLSTNKHSPQLAGETPLTSSDPHQAMFTPSSFPNESIVSRNPSGYFFLSTGAGSVASNVAQSTEDATYWPYETNIQEKYITPPCGSRTGTWEHTITMSLPTKEIVKVQYGCRKQAHDKAEAYGEIVKYKDADDHQGVALISSNGFTALYNAEVEKPRESNNTVATGLESALMARAVVSLLWHNLTADETDKGLGSWVFVAYDDQVDQRLNLQRHWRELIDVMVDMGESGTNEAPSR